MKFKLSKTKAKEFAQKMEEIHKNYNFIQPKNAIRIGCKLKYYSIARDCVIEGVIKKSSYGSRINSFGESKDLHFFTLETDAGSVRVRGKNLYPYLLSHEQGFESLNIKKEG